MIMQIIQSILIFFRENPVVGSFSVAIIVLIFGHILAIRRDKRKKVNEIFIPIREELLIQINTLESGQFITSCIGDDDIIAIEMHLGKSKIDGFRKTVTEYKQAELKCGHFDHGRFIVDDLSGYIKMSHKLLSFIQVK